MENTSCGSKCPFVKTGFCNSEEECPNYVESWWKEGQTGDTKLVKDCVPKRLMIQIAQLQSRFESVQAASEEARNETCLMKGHFLHLVELSKKVICDQEKISHKCFLEIPDKNE